MFLNECPVSVDYKSENWIMETDIVEKSSVQGNFLFYFFFYRPELALLLHFSHGCEETKRRGHVSLRNL